MRRRRRERVKGFLPYVLVTSGTLIVSTLILFSVYANSATKLLAEKSLAVLDASVTLLSRLQLASLPSFFNFQNDADVRDFLLSPNGNTLTAFKALSKIDQFVLNFDFIDSIYLSSRSNGVLSTKSGWERLTGESDPGLRSVIGANSRYPSYSYINRRVSFSGSRPVPVWTLVLRLSDLRRTADSPCIVINISSDRVRRQVETSQETLVDSLVILSSSGEILTASDQRSIGMKFQDYYRSPSGRLLEEYSGTEIVTEDGVPRMLSWVTQPQLGWKFLVFADEAEFLAPVKEIRNMAILLGLGLTIASVALMLWISIGQERAFRRNESILGFLSGTLESTDVPRIARLLKAEGPWTAMIVRIDGHSSLRDAEKHRAQQALGALVARTFDRNGVCLAYRDWGSFVFVEAGKNPPEAVVEAWKEINRGLRPTVSARVYSEPVVFQKISERFTMLERAFEGFFMFPHGSVSRMEAGEGKPKESTTLRIVESDLDRYENALRHGELVALSALFDYFERLFADCERESVFRFWVQSMANRADQVLGLLFEFSIGKSRAWFEQTVERIETFDQARELFEGLVRAVETRPVGTPLKHIELIHRVKELVSLHLEDKTFGTAKLADETGFSVSYLRELFKQIEGVSLMSYISQSRLEEAKRLLGQTSLPVAEICEKTGFLNTSYFFTYFKKLEGLTPTEYRLKSATRRTLEKYGGHNAS